MLDKFQSFWTRTNGLSLKNKAAHQIRPA